ncbi:RagB/SusD family nutrient uptake outer membrane protein [Sediminibacterium sp.]|uniref:RagB/SusD family nutrient uptake outer membrane protein n=1 Tax=Sediminibacterium sp. TaxID=1917865 RepID=UPI0025D7AC57|nr:RagB/SusD family nutrient uptake outer membrane protein [Sediminibacterium sp.]MBW0176891.1 RagB/SusD family nutrient uptake outer membrane protein [Sediminibacterium sp.]
MNNKYFNKLTVIAVAGTMLLTTGCKKYLDQQPITDVGSEMVFQDVASTRKALAGAYSRLVGDAGFGIRLSLYYTVDTDEMQGPTGNADNDRRDIARYAATSGNAQITNPFNQLFTGIEYANICIANIPKMDMYNSGSEQEKKQLRRLLGEALTLRAQFYFQAIVNWGDLPTHFQPSSTVAASAPFPTRTDRDTIYNRLLADLKVAADLVPWRNEVTGIGDQLDERITKGTVKGLRARIALFRGGFGLRSDGSMKRPADYLTYYQIAKDECNEIIASNQHSLNPSFRALWKDQVNARVVADPNGELMFQASGIGRNATADTKLAYYNGPTVNNLGNKSINVLPTYFYAFDQNDLRRDVTCAPYNVAANGSTKIGQALTAMCDGKYRRDWISGPVVSPTDAVQYFGLKWQILRYSDVLLMLAEAENEISGPTAAAYNAVNQVRRRGFGKAIGTPDVTVDLPTGLSKAAFFDAVVKERSLELGGEGVRKFDLIRWNLLATKIAQTKTALLAMSTRSGAYSTLPEFMYYRNNSTADDATLWANSFYAPTPGTTPAASTRVNWAQAAVNTTALARYATGFVTGKSELLPIPQPARDANPNLTQNPGY